VKLLNPFPKTRNRGPKCVVYELGEATCQYILVNLGTDGDLMSLRSLIEGGDVHQRWVTTCMLGYDIDCPAQGLEM
jgi:hypothetical protein